MKRGARGATMIANGFWPAPYPAKAAARRQLGLRSDGIYVGFMGRTITATELAWLAASARLASEADVPCRFAICGMPKPLVEASFGELAGSLDDLGTLSPEDSRSFAAALDLGLLPLEDAPLNRARYPIKFSE